jgi:hypothetical protein
MTQQNIQQEIESARAVGDNKNSASEEGAAPLNVQVAPQLIKEKPGFLENYCAANPGASQCRVYDV